MSGAVREVLALEPAAFAGWTARVLQDAIHGAVAARGACRIVLAGGSTPAAVYRELAQRADMPWSLVEVFIGDERCVPPDHSDSNFRMIHETLLSVVPIPLEQVHRLRGELGSQQAAAEYDQLLAPHPEPKFDVVVNGIGADGHTASVFPGDEQVITSRAWAMPAVAPPQFAIAERVGLTLRALCSTRVSVVLCTGESKRAVRDTILNGDAAAQQLPAARLRGLDRTLWVVDA